MSHPLFSSPPVRSVLSIISPPSAIACHSHQLRFWRCRPPSFHPVRRPPSYRPDRNIPFVVSSLFSSPIFSFFVWRFFCCNESVFCVIISLPFVISALITRAGRIISCSSRKTFEEQRLTGTGITLMTYKITLVFCGANLDGKKYICFWGEKTCVFCCAIPWFDSQKPPDFVYFSCFYFDDSRFQNAIEYPGVVWGQSILSSLPPLKIRWWNRG